QPHKGNCNMTVYLPIFFTSYGDDLWGHYGDPLGIIGTLLQNLTDVGQRAQADIEAQWQGATSDGKIGFRTVVTPIPFPGLGLNQVQIYKKELHGGTDRTETSVGRRDYDTGLWEWREDPRVYAHEAGHLMGLRDHYIRHADNSTTPMPGYQGSLMASLR